MTLSSVEFVERLETENREFFTSISERERTYWTEPLRGKAAADALLTRWFNEWYIGVEVIGRFVGRVPSIHMKQLLGRQIGDEAKHAQIIERRIHQLGGSVKDFKPSSEQVAFADLLDSLEYPEEFFAAEQVTVETESVIRNEKAVERFDAQTAKMFEEEINPDERYHVKIGYMGLKLYATTTAAQERALKAAKLAREAHRKMVVRHHAALIS